MAWLPNRLVGNLGAVNIQRWAVSVFVFTQPQSSLFVNISMIYSYSFTQIKSSQTHPGRFVLIARGRKLHKQPTFGGKLVSSSYLLLVPLACRLVGFAVSRKDPRVVAPTVPAESVGALRARGNSTVVFFLVTGTVATFWASHGVLLQVLLRLCFCLRELPLILFTGET